jgi:prolipoprotein diacylglyceryl transferase
VAPIWNVDPILFTLPVVHWPVRWYGLFFACAFLAGFALFRWQTERGGRGAEAAASFIVPGFLGTLVGARAGHILFYNLDYFLSDPSWFFRVWEGGLASHGAAIGLALALLWQSWRTREPFWDLCDRFSFSAAAGAALIRVGNLFNSEIVGKIAPDGSRFAVRFPRHDFLLPEAAVPPRYPTQVLEFLLGAVVLGALLLADRLLGRERRPRGALAALFLILYFAGRFCIEFLKERQNAADTLALSRGQMLSVLPFLFGAGLLVWSVTRPRPPAPPESWVPPGSDRKGRSRKASGKAVGASGGRGKGAGRGRGKGRAEDGGAIGRVAAGQGKGRAEGGGASGLWASGRGGGRGGDGL